MIGPFNEVYRIKEEEIIQIDKSLDSRISIDSYKLLINDTIVKFGGYGFWSQRNFMYYFDFSSLEWEYFKTKTNSLVDGSFLGNFNQNKEKVIFYGGLKTDPLNRIKKIKSFEIVQYDMHKIVAESFFLPDFEKELRVRQQMLWFMNNLLKGSSFTNLTYLLAYFFT